jgi:hypothetical protein
MTENMESHKSRTFYATVQHHSDAGTIFFPRSYQKGHVFWVTVKGQENSEAIFLAFKSPEK